MAQSCQKKGFLDCGSEVEKRLVECALLHLASVAEIAGDMAHSLVEDETSVSLLPYDPEHRRGELLDKIVARLDYVADGLAGLRAGGLVSGGENQGCQSTGQGEIGQQAQTQSVVAASRGPD